jgi:hypothetical protein
MNIPLGHKLKLMKRIKDMRRDRGMTVPESRQGGPRNGGGGTEVDSEDLLNKPSEPSRRGRP